MTQREKTAFHEAGHFVLGLVSFYNEPKYSLATHLYIDKYDDNKGQLRGFSFYPGYTEEEAMNIGNPLLEGCPKYPTHSVVKNQPIEIDKLKKEAIQAIGGLLSEHLYCGKSKPSFEGDGEQKYSDDLMKYKWLIKAIYGTHENLNSNNLAEDYEKSEELLLEKSNALWKEALVLISQKPNIPKAIKMVKDSLLDKYKYEGAELKQLTSDVNDILDT